jgi:NAD+ synthase (glutamine-hydrolysing)
MAFREKYPPEVIAHWLDSFSRQFFASQFKRDANPDGVKVGSVRLSQRGDWRMPPDASGAVIFREAQEVIDAIAS